MTTSAFKLNVDLGLMTMLAIGFALILDFLLLPALLLLGKRKPEASKAPEAILPAPSAATAN
jgi:predicted RND superfamily exporter protein